MKCGKCKYMRDKYEMQPRTLGTVQDIMFDSRICTNEESPYYLECINTIYDEDYQGSGCEEGEPYEEI